MLVQLRNESGDLIDRSFSSMEDAAKWCLEYPEYGITTFPEEGEEEWDRKEFQATLDYYA